MDRIIIKSQQRAQFGKEMAPFLQKAYKVYIHPS